jgi:hypothetical protein
MPGELWRSTTQIGLESVPGTSVPATRKMYFREPVLTREREPRLYRFATGSRDNARAQTLGPVEAGFTGNMPMSSEEIIELLLMTVKAGVTPTTPGGTLPRLWTFTPGVTLAAATVEWDDGARAWEATGSHINELTITGNVNEENIVEFEGFSRNVVQEPLTPALSDRVPTFIEGWESKIYIENLGGVPGTTVIPAFLQAWEVTIANGLERQYFADNTLSAGAINIGELEVTAELTVSAVSAQALTEFNHMDAEQYRLVRLMFGDNEVIETTYKRFVTIDLPGGWSAVELGEDNAGARMYRLSMQGIYDSSLGAGLQIRAQNSRITAF